MPRFENAIRRVSNFGGWYNGKMPPRPNKHLREAARPAIYVAGGWRRRVSRQPGQVRKEAALTNRMRVAVQPLTAALWRHCVRSEAIQSQCEKAGMDRHGGKSRLAKTDGRKRSRVSPLGTVWLFGA
jgi:hypothetical protein